MAVRTVAPPPDGYLRVRMTVAYDGSGFHGFATNPDVRTVQDDIEAVLAKVLREPTTTTCAGRTDRGVHARGQVMTFDADANHFDSHSLTRALNRMLAPQISVRDVRATAPDFDARISCVGRSYRYRILNSPWPDPLVHHLSWDVREPLELAAMQTAADQILGEHDFSSFSKKNKSKVNETFSVDDVPGTLDVAGLRGVGGHGVPPRNENENESSGAERGHSGPTVKPTGAIRQRQSSRAAKSATFTHRRDSAPASERVLAAVRATERRLGSSLEGPPPCRRPGVVPARSRRTCRPGCAPSGG